MRLKASFDAGDYVLGTEDEEIVIAHWIQQTHVQC